MNARRANEAPLIRTFARSPGFPLILKKVLRTPCALLLACIIALPGILPAQDQQPAPPPSSKKAAPSADIFSGTVTLLSEGSLTVERKVLGRDAVMRTFVMDDKTTVEGRVRPRARVTVRFRALDEGGFVAVHIIVR